jgi:hypothetical protein
VIEARTDVPTTDRWTRRAASTALAYFHLTKPRVIELLLVTTLPSMILAAGEMPSLGLIVSVLVGGALAAGGANTINCWIERDRDQIMRRTAHRPLPHGDVKPEGALVFGLALEVAAFVLLWSTVAIGMAGVNVTGDSSASTCAVTAANSNFSCSRSASTSRYSRDEIAAPPRTRGRTASSTGSSLLSTIWLSSA